MNQSILKLLTAGLLGLCLAPVAVAQESQQDFPNESRETATCSDVDWNENMLENHPRLVDACQEVVVVDGQSWARFDAKFVEMDRDDNVVFSVRDRRDRSVEEVTLVPRSDQVAYIDGRATEFRRLRTTDSINLYVPEGEYGFATEPGAAPEQFAEFTPRRSTPRADTERTATQRSDTRPSVLPATASSLPWLAIIGFVSLLGGVVLTMRRWR